METIKDSSGVEQAFDPSDVVCVESSSHGVRTVVLDGVVQQAPMALVYLKDGRSFMVDGTAGAFTAAILHPETKRSKEGW